MKYKLPLSPNSVQKVGFSVLLVSVFTLVTSVCFRVAVKASALQQSGRNLITREIDENRRVVLHGNIRGEANRQNDRGRVDDDFRLENVLLLLKRSPEQEQELNTYLGELQDRNSPNFHNWLTAAELGRTYGISDDDIKR